MATLTNYTFHGFPVRENKPSVLDDRFLVVPKPELVPGTGDTKVNVDDKIDVYELTQSYKDQCGVEFMLKQVRLGMVSQESLADDGKHSGDASIVPVDPVDAYQASRKAQETKEALAKQLGIAVEDLSEENISAKVAELFGKVDGKTQEVSKDE